MRNIFKKRKIEDTAKEQIAKVLPMVNGASALEYLIELIKHVRPENKRNFADAEIKFKAVLYQLQNDKTSLFSLRRSLLSQFRQSNLVNAITESGIVSGRGFVQEVMRKLKHKILPALQKPDDFLFVINRVFYQKSDHIWVEGIDQKLWTDFFEIIGIQVNLTEPHLIRQLQQALQILSYRIVNLSLEKDISQRYENIQASLEPFFLQNNLVRDYLQKFANGDLQGAKNMLPDITEALHNSTQTLLRIRNERKQLGTSLAQTFILTRLQTMLQRMHLLIDVLDVNNVFDTESFVRYFKTIVKNENRKNSLGEFLSQNTSVLAYQIAEHGGRRGERFITSSRKEFAQNFKSAMIGGVVVSFVAIFKNLLTKVVAAPFLQGLLYSVNYSLGFVAIEETGGTLATKQPAYTANNVASNFDQRKLHGQPDIRNLAITVARVSRSQIASFAGNLILVFPLTYLLAALYTWATGNHITATAEATQKLMKDQQPGMAWVYACFTGFFLFLSGIIAGYVENHVVYGQIPKRLKTHPILKNTLSNNRLEKLANWVDNNLGALAGSISLGFFLGMAGFIGKTFSIPFDIRHITISAGNSAIAFFDSNHAVQLSEILLTLLGVAGIGFLNFFVSFSLAFYVAVKSRGIHLKDYPNFLNVLWRYFVKFPSDFIRPHKKLRHPDDLL
jgi:site-specific recombinase